MKIKALANKAESNHPLELINSDFFNPFNLTIWLVFLIMSLSFAVTPARAESTKTGDEHLNYRTIKYEANKPVTKPADGKGRLPTFAQADINGDHYLTKDELQHFPYLLQVFDKIDAGSDGKLEQHEYQNLKMETKRAGEVR
jgi:hypothetical protein